MAKRSPYQVLGVNIDANGTAIKAAWRRLARQHHPDLTGGDAAASRAATRQMAEINAAYEELRDPARRRAAADRARSDERSRPRPSAAESQEARADGAPADGAQRGRPGPPAARPGRPVTARLDMSDTFTPRNQTTNGNRRSYAGTAAPPLRSEPTLAEPPRASDPTGPLRRAQMRHFRPPPSPALADALALGVEFGKFHGHTLGEIAAFEPSYIDWLAGTITRDRELVAAARVVKADLDARGIPRVRRATRPGAAAQP